MTSCVYAPFAPKGCLASLGHAPAGPDPMLEFYPTGRAGGWVVVTDSGLIAPPRRFYPVVVP